MKKNIVLNFTIIFLAIDFLNAAFNALEQFNDGKSAMGIVLLTSTLFANSYLIFKLNSYKE